MSPSLQNSSQKEIIISGEVVTYTHRIHRMSRSLRLVIHRDGRIIVVTPKWVSDVVIAEFISKKFLWIKEKIDYFNNNTQKEIVKHTEEEIQAYKQVASKIVQERLSYFNAYYNFVYKNVTIKNVITRWGSCSSKGNLNFNYKIALLPPELSDYIVVHELCHLQEMNHGKNFWNLVEKQIPNHKELRKRLRVYK